MIMRLPCPGSVSYLGSEAITKQKFDLSSGAVAFEFVGRYAQTQPGIIAGLFTFGGKGDHHDEIDFEGMANNFSQIQTNIYKDEPSWTGRPIMHDLTSDLSNFHTYRVEWLPTKVRWFVDNVMVRENTSHVPTLAQAVHLNIWAPPASWKETAHESLSPVSSQDQNRSFFFEVDSIKVEQLSSFQGSHVADHLRGTHQSDYLYGGSGNDLLHALAGDDVIDGGDGVDVARFEASSSGVTVVRQADGALLVSGDTVGTNTVRNVELLHFNDRVVLTHEPSVVQSLLFDERAYLAHYADVSAAVSAGQVVSGFDHYQQWGSKEQRDPNPLFHEIWYLQQNADVAQAVQRGQFQSGMEHFLAYGASEGRNPSEYMDLQAYLDANPDVALAGVNPLTHYLVHGANEGRAIQPVADFI